MMPTPNRFLLKYSGNTFECEPDNWADVEMGFTREGYGINREVTSEFTFSRQAAVILKGLFEASGFNAVCTLEFAKRQNDWTYEVFNTFAADFSTYSYDRGKVKLSFIENSVRKLLSDNKGTDYQFDLPTTNNLLYTGVSTVKENKMQAVWGSMVKFNSSCFPIFSKRVVRTSTTLFDFEPFEMRATAKISGTFNIEISIRALTISWPTGGTGGNYTNRSGALELVKISGPDVTFLKTWTTPKLAGKQTRFEDYSVYNLDDVTVIAGDKIILWYDSQVHDAPHMYVETTNPDGYLKLTNVDPSIYQAHEVPVVSHDWLLEKLLRKIVPFFADETLVLSADILDYNLPLITSDVDYVPVLTSGSGLIQDGGATITVSLEKVLKSLKCLYGADYDITDNKMRVDYASTFFSTVQATDTLSNAIDIIPINKPVISVDMEHVYNKITVGWETDENATNGQLEINCKNVFSIPNAKVEKELDLVHPFKGSMYTIEQYMLDKDSDTNTTKDSDTSVFIFAVNPMVDNSTTLYRAVNYVWRNKGTANTAPYATVFYSPSNSVTPITPAIGEFYRDINSRNYYSWNGTAYVNEPHGPENTPPMAYNIPFSPMRLMLANISYIAVSLYLAQRRAYKGGGVFYSDSAKTIAITPIAGMWYFDLADGQNIYLPGGQYYYIPGGLYYLWNGTDYVQTDAPTLIAFASTDRKADYYSKIGTTVVNEDSIPSASIPAPLFLPISVEFDTALKLWTLASINDNLYKYFELINKNTAETYKIWIKDITLQMTRINSQTWKGIAYDL